MLRALITIWKCVESVTYLFLDIICVNTMLVKITKNHCKDIYEYANDKDFQFYLNGNDNYIYSDAVHFVNMLIEQNLSGKRLYFGIELQGKVVGTAGFLNISSKDKTAELGYGISRNFWGTGILRSHVIQIIEIGFSNLMLEKILIGVKCSNYRSISFAKKLGASELNTLNSRKWFQILRP